MEVFRAETGHEFLGSCQVVKPRQNAKDADGAPPGRVIRNGPDQQGLGAWALWVLGPGV